MNEQTNAPGQQTLTIHQAVDLALEHHIAGRLPEAESIYMQVLEKEQLRKIAAQRSEEERKQRQLVKKNK